MKIHVEPMRAEDWKHTHYLPMPVSTFQMFAFVCGRQTDAGEMVRRVEEGVMPRTHNLGSTRAEVVDCPDFKAWLEHKMGGEH